MTRIGGRRGAETVEFALVAPVFIGLLIGMFDISWLFYTESTLDTATHLGCRAGALVDPGMNESNLSDVEDAAMTALVAAMTSHGLSECDERCTASVETFGTSPSRALTCKVTFDFVPLIGLGLTEMTLSSTQVVRLEWQRG